MFKSAFYLLLVLVLTSCTDTGPWQHVELDKLKEDAKAQNKQILVYFSMEHCQPCRVLEKHLESPQLEAQIEKRFVTSKVDMEPERTAIEDRYAIKMAPTVLVLDADANELDRLMGYSWRHTNTNKNELGRTKIYRWISNLPSNRDFGPRHDKKPR